MAWGPNYAASDGGVLVKLEGDEESVFFPRVCEDLLNFILLASGR